NNNNNSNNNNHNGSNGSGNNAAAVATTARNIHLRPPQPQPLNISALNASTCSTLYNGGGRTLSTITTTTSPLKPLLTPLTPLTPNGHCNNGNGNGNGSIHHHTYTNQHILASSQLQHQHSQQQHQQHFHHHQQQQQQQQQQPPLPPPPPPPTFSHNFSNCNNLTANTLMQKVQKHGPSPREALNSLGLLCLVSLLLALLSLIFLLKISPNSREDAFATTRTTTISNEDFIIVYDVTLALCALSLSLNLCCLLVCAIQFLFAVKLRSPMFDGRENKYLEKSSASRTCAVGGFFISIPVFLTGIILYTFNHFHSTPAIITSILIGLGIVFCGGAMVHNVFVWQKEKTMSYRSVPLNMSLLSAGQLPLSPVPHMQFQVPSSPPPPPPGATSSSSLMPTSPIPMHGPQQHYPVGGQAISVTPVSPNHSHGSFNPLLCLGSNNLNGGGAINSSFLVRTATATPPTPKPSGSISPGIPATLDMSNITNISLHELSTLV
ncbi:uncharacterized protein Dwil_GK19856, partial [Drosophila willistoni]